MKHALTTSSLVCLLLMPYAASAQDFDLSPNVDFTTWTLLGDAGASNTFNPGWGTDSYLSLTWPGVGGQAGGAINPVPLLIDFNAALTIHFRFFVAHGSEEQGDGFTFFMSGNNLPTLGYGGSDLGYGGGSIGGYAFAVDTFNFGGEPEAVSLQILADNDVSPLAYTETGLADIQPPDYYQWVGTVGFTPDGSNNETGDLYFEIHQAFTGATYRVDYSGADWFGIAQDIFDQDSNFLGRGVYIGFTAGSGLADDGHFIGSLTPIPEPEAWALLLAGLGLLGIAVRRRQPAAG
jgi:hypothetical protein